MEKQPVSAQPLLSSGARGQKGATAVADAVESPRTADFDLWEDAPPEKDARCCGVSRRCGVALVAALSVAAVGGFFLSSRRTRPITEGLIGCGTKEQVCARHAPSPVLSVAPPPLVWPVSGSALHSGQRRRCPTWAVKSLGQ